MNRTRSQLIRTPQERTARREHTEPVFLTSSFMFDDAGQAADREIGGVCNVGRHGADRSITGTPASLGRFDYHRDRERLTVG